MKKSRSILVLGALVSMTLLTACGDKAAQSESTNSAQSSSAQTETTKASGQSKEEACDQFYLDVVDYQDYATDLTSKTMDGTISGEEFQTSLKAYFSDKATDISNAEVKAVYEAYAGYTEKMFNMDEGSSLEDLASSEEAKIVNNKMETACPGMAEKIANNAMSDLEQSE